jgi:dTDP-glucose 4,6-dehydratase
MPGRSFRDGLRQTVEWYRTHRVWVEAVRSGQYLNYYETQYAARLASSRSKGL